MECLNLKTEYIKKPLNIIIQRYDILTVKTDHLNDLLYIKTYSIATISNVYCYKVCSNTQRGYLNVAPNIVWLTPDTISGEFDIYSNVVWRID